MYASSLNKNYFTLNKNSGLLSYKKGSFDEKSTAYTAANACTSLARTERAKALVKGLAIVGGGFFAAYSAPYVASVAYSVAENVGQTIVGPTIKRLADIIAVILPPRISGLIIFGVSIYAVCKTVSATYAIVRDTTPKMWSACTAGWPKNNWDASNHYYKQAKEINLEAGNFQDYSEIM